MDKTNKMTYVVPLAHVILMESRQTICASAMKSVEVESLEESSYEWEL